MNPIISRWVLIPLLAIFAVFGLFWREMVRYTTDSMVNFISSDADPAIVTSADLKNHRTVIFEPLHQAIHMIRISDMKVLSHETYHASISITLASAVKENDYPNLRIILLGANNAMVRSIEFSPDQYSHASNLISETVTLSFDLKLGEQRFVVEAFYPKAGVKS